MKWPKRTAQGFSPGFAAKAFDLKVSTEVRYPALQVDYIASERFNIREADRIGRPFRAFALKTVTQG